MSEQMRPDDERRWRLLPGVTTRQLVTVALFANAILVATVLDFAITAVAAPNDPNMSWHAGLTALSFVGLSALVGLAKLAWQAAVTVRRCSHRRVAEVSTRLREDLIEAQAVIAVLDHERYQPATDRHCA